MLDELRGRPSDWLNPQSSSVQSVPGPWRSHIARTETSREPEKCVYSSRPQLVAKPARQLWRGGRRQNVSVQGKGPILCERIKQLPHVKGFDRKVAAPDHLPLAFETCTSHEALTQLGWSRRTRQCRSARDQ
jgi:hypothetical protein